MKKKHIIVIVLCVAVAVAATVGYGVCHRRAQGEENTLSSTDGAGYAEEDMPHADPMMVGKWRNTDNPHWYKVYYDDYDEDERLFWGKEWDESEDVFEEDLNYHGNSWFRWEKKGKILREYATMDMDDVPIHHAFTIKKGSTDTLIYHELDYKKIVYHFVRVQ